MLGFDSFVPGQALTYQDAVTSFTTLGVSLAHDGANVQLGTDLALTPNAALLFGYDGSFSTASDNHVAG